MPVKARSTVLSLPPDAALLGAAILAVNLPLLLGWAPAPLIFLPGAFRAGEWWRLLTHPLAHVSVYHALLDAGAFLLLYTGLRGSAVRRLVVSAACAGGSLLLTLALCPAVAQRGLCGLSGAAHGLMAVAALDHALDRSTPRALRRVAAGVFLVVAAKSAWEAVTGQVLCSALHLGAVGAPLPACHAGGVLGGVAVVGLQCVRELCRGTGFQPVSDTGKMPVPRGRAAQPAVPCMAAMHTTVRRGACPAEPTRP